MVGAIDFWATYVRSFSIPFDLSEDYAPSQGFYHFINCQTVLVSLFRVENLRQTLLV